MSKRLEGRSLLLVEDDFDLSKELEELFTFDGAIVTSVDTLDAAEATLREHPDKYELVVLDIMLPRTRAHLERVRELDEELARVRKVLRNAGEPQKDDLELERHLDKAYERREAILAEMAMLIDRMGGLRLLHDIYGPGKTNQKLPPVLVLTAVGDKRAIDEGMAILGRYGDWLVKPVMVDTLMEKVVKLIVAG